MNLSPSLRTGLLPASAPADFPAGLGGVAQPTGADGRACPRRSRVADDDHDRDDR